MANKQIKDFDVILNATGTSILVQNNTTDIYNKIAAENLGAAITSLESDVEVEGNFTFKNKSITFEGPTSGVALEPPPFLKKATEINFNGSTSGIVELDFTGDVSGSEVWGLKIKKDTDAWGIKSDGMIHGHHLMIDFGINICDVSAVKYISPAGNNWNNTDVGVFEADLTPDSNAANVWGIKIKSGSNAWGIKANGDAVVRNFEANTLDSNQLNLVDMNASVITESTILMSNHGGGYSPAAWEIQNSEGATSMTFPPDILNRKYTSMASASLGGVPLGGAYIEVDSIINPTTARLSYRLT